jgi:hypothetical protein
MQQGADAVVLSFYHNIFSHPGVCVFRHQKFKNNHKFYCCLKPCFACFSGADGGPPCVFTHAYWLPEWRWNRAPYITLPPFTGGKGGLGVDPR